MIRRLPVLPTLIVLAAVAVMIRLGLWQIDRMHEKEALLTRYASAEAMSAEVPWPSGAPRNDLENPTWSAALYRRSRVECRSVSAVTSKAGINRAGEPGQAHFATCKLADGSIAEIVLGWSRDPKSPIWAGGLATGVIAPGPRLVADPPLAGLVANARPDPSAIPNNHWSYAVQWFLFALVALVIFAIAVRKRLKP